MKTLSLAVEENHARAAAAALVDRLQEGDDLEPLKSAGA